MKFFRDGRKARREKDMQWRPHFALFPVRVGKTEWRWLEWVETRTVWEYSPSSWGDWLLDIQYRAVGNEVGWSQTED